MTGYMSFPREHRRNYRSKGFSLLEIAIVMSIALVLVLLAIPLINNTTASLKIQGATAAVTGAIQSTRYQAIFNGCQYQLAMTKATSMSQVLGQTPTNGVCSAGFTNVCPPGVANCPVPWAGGEGGVTIPADTTFTFTPGGRVSNAAGSCPCTLVLTRGVRTSTITISNFGNINVVYAP
jgi:prepilin-type N-terminal cleavage/methylation domain-containing protein